MRAHFQTLAVVAVLLVATACATPLAPTVRFGDARPERLRTPPHALSGALKLYSRTVSKRAGQCRKCSQHRGPMPAQETSHLAELKQHAPEGVTKVAFAWPVEPVLVTSPFGPRIDPITGVPQQQHQGVDLAAGKGQAVTASAQGKVLRAESASGHYGNWVELEHGRGVSTRYAHLSSIVLKPGQEVSQGELLGFAGDTGRVTGPHLHFELRRDGEAVDPLEELEEFAADEEEPAMEEDEPVAGGAG